MSFQFIKTNIDDLMIIMPHRAEDARGMYKKYYERDQFFANGISSEFTESSIIYSSRGTVRGLHYQTRCSQAKLVQVLKGKVYDVALDLRGKSATFGKCFQMLLAAEDHKALYIPPGFAHGFQSLEDNTVFAYQCSGKYIPDACGCIQWNDADLDISWPILTIEEVILSEKDRLAQTFSEYYTDIKKIGEGERH